MPPRDTVDKRPNEIHDLVLQGVTLEEIGRYFGLTRERVRQLHKKSDRLQSTISKIEGFVSCGVTTSKLIEELGVTSRGLNRVLISCKRNDLLDNLALTDQAAEDELLLQLPNWVRTHLGITINELASAFEISCEKAQNTLSADSKMLMLQEDPFGEFVLLIGEDRKFSANSVTYTRESILVSLQNETRKPTFFDDLLLFDFEQSSHGAISAAHPPNFRDVGPRLPNCWGSVFVTDSPEIREELDRRRHNRMGNKVHSINLYGFLP